MAAVKTISRSAIAAFSPSENLIAAGTVAGSLDSSLSSSTCLELFKLDLASDDVELPLVGSCATAEPLNRLSWAGEAGLLAGGLADGSINIWNPAALIVGLEFNPITPNFLASGDAEGTVYIWDLTDTAAPKPCPPLQWKGASSISHLSWNRKVSHIFATTSNEGVCVVWDLKKRKSVLSFSDPQSKLRYSALQWNPEVPTELIVAVDDDNMPCLQAWDLRKANHPTRVLTGHSKGILSLAWCPSDSSMLLSSAKDNRTLCWDVSGEIIGELPRGNSWNFDVQWSTRTPGILSASSYDGRVGIYSIESCHHNEKEYGRTSPGNVEPCLGNIVSFRLVVTVVLKAPKWLKRPVGTSFGFGGKLVSFKKKAENSIASEVKVHSLAIEEGTVKRSTEFEEAVTNGDRRTLLKSFCDRKASEAESDQEREVWEYLKLMFDDDGGRKALLNQLGFQFSEVDALAEEFEEKAEIQTDDFFENLQEPKEPEVAAGQMNGKDETTAEGTEEQEVDDTSRDSDNAIEEALVVGDFKGAVAQCISMNRIADALSIAYAGSQALGEKTRDEYVKKNQRSYFKVLSAIVTRDFSGLVANRPLAAWKQTLALLATYARGEDWSQLANALASRLDLGGDVQAATICYICAGNVEKTIEVLSRAFSTPNHGKHVTTNLQDLVEKSLVLAVAVELKRLTPALAKAVESFCELLASEGLVESAGAYLSLVPGELPQSLTILRDRIQRSQQPPQVPVAAPAPAPAPVASRQSPMYPNTGYTPSYNQVLRDVLLPVLMWDAHRDFLRNRTTTRITHKRQRQRWRSCSKLDGSKASTANRTSRPASNYVQPCSCATSCFKLHAPAPPPTVHTVDTQNVKDELKPVVSTFKRLFAETSDMSNPVKKREVDDNSRKLGALFAKLNSGDVSPNVETKLLLLCQALDSRNFPSAHEILGDLTSREWDECGVWLTAVRRITKAHQQSMR
ncbi:hypothetical protein SELMODRAFT_230767 [Selaginella moellendorffii]|uniref:Uncharacterized protein n=1 Tax=Selaginella moellendorffii TaxID=88036 RepID=D8R5I5_SELML|nr:hypothetical protein SELMODRAFT_230767 [Selaginella moellendorffii]